MCVFLRMKLNNYCHKLFNDKEKKVTQLNELKV